MKIYEIHTVPVLLFLILLNYPHEKINQCLSNINLCLTNIFKIQLILTNI